MAFSDILFLILTARTAKVIVKPLKAKNSHWFKKLNWTIKYI